MSEPKRYVDAEWVMFARFACVCSFLVGAGIAYLATVHCQHTEAINHLAAHYHPQTGIFTWGPPPPSAEKAP